MSVVPEPFRFGVSEEVRAIAMRLPDATEGSSCVNRAFSAGGKNFAFLGEQENGCGLRLKLRESVPEIESLAERHPDRFEVGAHGWAMLRFGPDDHPPTAELERWVTESFRLLAPKRLVAELS